VGEAGRNSETYCDGEAPQGEGEKKTYLTELNYPLLLAEGVGVGDLGDGDAVRAIRGQELLLLEEREERVVLELESASEDHWSPTAEVLLVELSSSGQTGPDL
jgi:hypothetical protein